MASYISNFSGSLDEYPVGIFNDFVFDYSDYAASTIVDLLLTVPNSSSYDPVTKTYTYEFAGGTEATFKGSVSSSSVSVSAATIVTSDGWGMNVTGSVKVMTSSGVISGSIKHIAATYDGITVELNGSVSMSTGSGTISDISVDFGDGSVFMKGSLKLNGETGEFSGYLTSLEFTDADGNLGLFTGIKVDVMQFDAYASFDAMIAGLMSGNDTITGTKFDDVLQGFDGNDKLSGGLGNDALYGGNGNDKLDGGDGNDILSAGGGIDNVIGGKGTDTLILDGDFDDYVYARPTSTTYTITEKDNPQNVIAVSTVEFIEFNDGTKSIAEALANSPTKFDDYFDGNAWDDNIAMAGGLGNDTYVVFNDYDTILENAGQGTDTVIAKLDGYELADNVENLTIYAGVTDAQEEGELGYGTVEAFGNALNNVMTGNAADNLLDGGAGKDTMIGGDGNDQYFIDHAADKVIEVADQGIDTIYTKVSYKLSANVENLIFNGLETNKFSGTGNALDNLIVGGGANDKLSGGLGNDTLRGGLGNDALDGGLGNDIFVFDTALGVTNIDTIKGFLSGTDKIQLDTTIFSALTSGTLGAGEFASGAGLTAVATTADQHIIYDTATGNLFYDEDGSGTGAAIKFATLTGRPVLQASDFSVVTVL